MPMPLFDDAIPNELSAGLENDSALDYLNASVRPGCVAAREPIRTGLPNFQPYTLRTLDTSMRSSAIKKIGEEIRT